MTKLHQTLRRGCPNSSRKAARYRKNRRGHVAVLSAVMLVVVCSFLALALDIGYLMLARTCMQRSADAAALAACWSLASDQQLSHKHGNQAIRDVFNLAADYERLNATHGLPAILAENTKRNSGNEIDVGHWSPERNEFVAAEITSCNAVRVRLKAATLPLFFARIFDRSSSLVQSTAVATLRGNIAGFHIPGETESSVAVPILPIAIDEDTWQQCVERRTEDQFGWDQYAQHAKSHGDGISEFNLYPQDTGSSGNRGTVRIGTSNNSTSFLARQILTGVTRQDLAFHGGELRFDDKGELILGGNPGISAGIKDELAQIIGQPRIIPVFRSVEGNGSNAEYRITKFVGIRILEVNLTGGDKRVIAQPAHVITRTAIPGNNSTSDFVSLPVRLVN